MGLLRSDCYCINGKTLRVSTACGIDPYALLQTALTLLISAKNYKAGLVTQLFTSAPFLDVCLPIHTLYFTLLLRDRHNNAIPAIRTAATTVRAPNEFKG